MSWVGLKGKRIYCLDEKDSEKEKNWIRMKKIKKKTWRVRKKIPQPKNKKKKDKKIGRPKINLGDATWKRGGDL